MNIRKIFELMMGYDTLVFQFAPGAESAPQEPVRVDVYRGDMRVGKQSVWIRWGHGAEYVFRADSVKSVTPA